MRQCLLVKAGVVDYTTGLALQAQARQAVLAGAWDGSLVLLEHSPVITIGRGGGADTLRVGPEVLAAGGVELTHTDRGGNITCHNPGQLVGYPVLNLARWRQDVHWYVRTLEEVIIRTLAGYGLRCGRKARYTGVWLENAKIAAIGVSVRQWLTGHGFALNIANNLDLFRTIVPCGITEFGVTSVTQAGVSVTLDQVRDELIQQFSQVFECVLAEHGE